MSVERVAQRTLDVGLVLAAAPLVLPIAGIIALLVRSTSPGPVLYRARRVGRSMQPIDLLKFRSMRIGMSGPAVTRAGDPRITRVGAVLRSSKLDELPQLLNVLRGEMSLVGPRPEDPRYVAIYSTDQRRVLSVRPGLVGPAFLHFGDEQALLEQVAPADIDHYYRTRVLPEKLAIDLAYVDGWSLGSDLHILARSIARVVAPPSRERVENVSNGGVRSAHSEKSGRSARTNG